MLTQALVDANVAVPGVSGSSPDRATVSYAEVSRSLFERCGMGLASLDAELAIAETDGDFLRQFGRTAATMQGRRLTDFLHPGIREHMERRLADLLSGRSTRCIERYVALRPDGSEFTGQLTAVAVSGHESGSRSVVLVMQPDDVDQKHQARIDRGKVLTVMEARILVGVAAGSSTVKLAAELYLSRQGVEYHVSAMLRKFQVPNRPALVSRAYALGILSVGVWPPRVTPGFVQ